MRKTLICLCSIILCSASVWGAAPNTMNFQGLLTDSSGAPFGDGNYNVLFTIYDDSTGGAILWTEANTVVVTDGLFSTQLGTSNPLADSIFNSFPRYVGIQVGANPELSPRILLSSVPWSLQSAKADTAEFAYATNSSGGSVFTRWGNSTAPAGTELIYSGYAFGSHYTHVGNQDLLILESGDPGDSGSISGRGLLYPVEMEVSSSTLSAFISQDSKMKGAVCYSDSQTLIVWGTHSAPSGWLVLYTGFAMGPHYTNAGPGGCPVCVDHLNFESEVFSNENGALLYPIVPQTAGAVGVEPGLHNKLVKCVVVKKD